MYIIILCRSNIPIILLNTTQKYWRTYRFIQTSRANYVNEIFKRLKYLLNYYYT